METIKKKKILIVEDDPMIRNILRDILIKYKEEVEIFEVSDGDGAIRELFPAPPEDPPDFLVLDIILPYGIESTELLDARSDPHEMETGLRILHRIRAWEKETSRGNPLWVSVVTARANPDFLQKISLYLEKGGGKIYPKPFDDILFEHDFAHILGLESKVSSILIPTDYIPPVQLRRTPE